jgi:hypothetical protein
MGRSISITRQGLETSHFLTKCFVIGVQSGDLTFQLLVLGSSDCWGEVYATNGPLHGKWIHYRDFVLR